jgi:hypothetical protein
MKHGNVPQVKKLMENMEATRQEKESLAQRCHELELRLNLLQAEIHIFFFLLYQTSFLSKLSFL